MQKLLLMALLPVLCCSCAQHGIVVAHPAVVDTKTDMFQGVPSTNRTLAPGVKSHTVADPYGPQNAVIFDRPEGGEAESCGCGPGLDPKGCKTQDGECKGECFDSEGHDKGACGVVKLRPRLSIAVDSSPKRKAATRP
jgi:hypothetical protein